MTAENYDNRRRLRGTLLLLLLTAVFTVGLTFATVELPRLIDRALQDAVPTPGFDSHADQISRLKTELFMVHYHLRAIGYGCFAALLVLIVAGFSGRRVGLAAAGGLALMLPVFAQFAGVMFFLAGLGLLNVVWLPVLDVSLGLSRLGLVIRAPYDLLRWLLAMLHVNGYWPIVLFFIAAGLLIFFMGTFAWLSARSRGQAVADRWVYRISRHPQYLGWILWSYGVYLLLERGRYPRRSWGISASLPWLLSTMVIIGVAMLEELHMSRRHPEAYERYRRSAPFLFPLPAFIARLFALSSRILFKRDRPERSREVALVVSLYAMILMAASAFFYGGGMRSIASRVLPSGARKASVESLVKEIELQPGSRRGRLLADQLARSGDIAVEPMLRMLEDDTPELRVLAAERAHLLRSDRIVPALLSALADPVGDVRYHALRGLSLICGRECVEPVRALLDDPEVHIRIKAMQLLADLGSPAMVSLATDVLASPQAWQRSAAADALGALGAAEAVPALAAQLQDSEPAVRRSVVIALLRIGSPEARAALQAAGRDEDWEVRVYTAEALKRIPENVSDAP
jgi:protein-S-isoprenylcysteine O-methyltransferase Ste14